jgi:hypothetical protein
MPASVAVKSLHEQFDDKQSKMAGIALGSWEVLNRIGR